MNDLENYKVTLDLHFLGHQLAILKSSIESIKPRQNFNCVLITSIYGSSSYCISLQKRSLQSLLPPPPSRPPLPASRPFTQTSWRPRWRWTWGTTMTWWTVSLRRAPASRWWCTACWNRYRDFFRALSSHIENIILMKEIWVLYSI